jgi:hypothetical protein
MVISAKRLHGVIACAFLAAGALLTSNCGNGAPSEVGSAGSSGSGAVSGAGSGGAGNVSGAGGSAGGSGGGASGGAGPGSACVDASHVDAMQTHSLDVIGSGFDAYEGRMIRIVVTLGEPTYGIGEAPILGGSFEILLPSALGDYTGIGVYVDTVRDDACSPVDEILWQRTTGPASAFGPGFVQGPQGEIVWEVTPDTLMTFDQAGPCNINGIFDLSNRLPCPAED